MNGLGPKMRVMHLATQYYEEFLPDDVGDLRASSDAMESRGLLDEGDLYYDPDLTASSPVAINGADLALVLSSLILGVFCNFVYDAIKLSAKRLTRQAKEPAWRERFLARMGVGKDNPHWERADHALHWLSCSMEEL